MKKLRFNPNRCTGCRACEGACKQEYNLPIGLRWRLVTTKTDGDYPKLTKTYLSSACRQCPNPKCMKVCPVLAISKNEDNGIVKINKEICIGCEECVKGCPFGEMKYSTLTGKASKCECCEKRTSIGLDPACVNVCMTLALSWE